MMHNNLVSLWKSERRIKMYKVKCTLVQALRLCTVRTAYRRSRGIALPFHDHDTRREWGASVTPRPLITPRKDPVPTVQEAGRTPGPVWTGAENLEPTGIRSPDRPACSQSLYRLRYPAHNQNAQYEHKKKCNFFTRTTDRPLYYIEEIPVPH